ncbi:hypothetical protein KIN20_004333 [Parelaphostrongylus tenuis]|uniref:Uncharacterized protein n=1 Tax=Parelaphostrongylus tenuis TaxID=148309 RepID=A0AAD5QGT8_PARTN|nr:hypothetical protein KIN20_004333 [Parelaphostrongylus tenuis]
MFLEKLNSIVFVDQYKVTQMVHDFREQVVPQRFEDLRQKMVQVARSAHSCHQPQQAVRSTGIIRTTGVV